MAILLVRVEDPATLPMNEFFDYDGSCWALSRSRLETGTDCIRLEDFYDSDVRAEEIFPVMVLFVGREEAQGAWQVLGWYRDARVYRSLKLPSLFLEGNIRTDARNVVHLREKERFPVECSFHREGGFFGRHAGEETWYEIIEPMDSRYESLSNRVDSYRGQGDMKLFSQVIVHPDRRVMRSYESCIGRCRQIAGDLMSDRLEDIRQIKELLLCAERATVLGSRSPDGYYYQAMACHHLGQNKKAIKAAGKASSLDPDAGDIMALRAGILAAMGYFAEAADLFHQAWLEEADEDYLIMEGRTYMNAGQMDKAHDCFAKVSDALLLEENGINLGDMEKKWPFMNLRGISLGRLRGGQGVKRR